MPTTELTEKPHETVLRLYKIVGTRLREWAECDDVWLNGYVLALRESLEYWPYVGMLTAQAMEISSLKNAKDITAAVGGMMRSSGILSKRPDKQGRYRIKPSWWKLWQAKGRNRRVARNPELVAKPRRRRRRAKKV